MSRMRDIMAAGNAVGSAQAIVGDACAISGAGTTAADATLATAPNILISGGAGNSGVILPASNKGDSYNVKNKSGQTIILYPPTGATINTTTSLSFATAKSATIFFSSPTKCHSVPTVAS